MGSEKENELLEKIERLEKEKKELLEIIRKLCETISQLVMDNLG